MIVCNYNLINIVLWMHFIAVSALVCTFICYCIGVHFVSVIALVYTLFLLLHWCMLYFCYCIGVYFISVIASVYTSFLLLHWCTLYFCYCSGVYFISVIALVYTLFLLLHRLYLLLLLLCWYALLSYYKRWGVEGNSYTYTRIIIIAVSYMQYWFWTSGSCYVI